MCLILDVVEVAKVPQVHYNGGTVVNNTQSHTGIELANVFANILKDFRIADKVSSELYHLK